MESFLQLFNDYENIYTVRTYFENGNIKTEIPYKNNLKHGTGIEYKINGIKTKTTDFVNGLKHGYEIEYYDNGAVFIKTPYEMGNKHGILNIYHSNSLDILR